MKKAFFLTGLFALFILSVFSYSLIGVFKANLLADIFYNLSAFTALLAGVFVLKQYGFKNPHGRSFFFISAGLACTFLGDVLWTLLEHAWGIKAFPSFVDGIYLLSYPLYFWGFFREHQMDKTNLEAKKKAVGIFIAALFLIFTSYFGVYQAYDAENALLENVFGIFYGVADMIISILLILIFLKALSFRQGKFFLPWLCIFYGFLMNVMADTMYAIYFEVYDLGGIFYALLDLTWISGYLFIAAGLGLIYYSIKDVQDKVKGSISF